MLLFPIPQEQAPIERLAALVVARGGAILVSLGGTERWRQLPGYTMAPIELPGVRVLDGASPSRGAAVTATWVFGRQARALSSIHTYGRTAAHAIDRVERSPIAEPAPLIYLERGMEPEDGATALRRAEIYVYRGALDGAPQAGAAGAGLLWLPLAALRQAIRGLPLEELLTMRGVAWMPSPGATIPDDLFVFVPAEYGERHLLRVAAKYGAHAVFQEEGDSHHGA